MSKISKKIIGFDNNLISLKNNFLKKVLPNSLIFFGNKGIGKKTFCYFFINQLFCELNNTQTTNHTNLIYKNSHPNIKFIEKNYDEKTKKLRNFIIIDQIRDLDNFIYQSSFDGLPKFIIIDSSDDLNLNSSNALLKILEEPRDNTFFILISHIFSSLLPTIRSRCIKIKFSNPSLDEFNEILLNSNNKITNSDLNFLFDISNGSPGLALELYSENIYKIFDIVLAILLEKKPLSSSIIDLSNNVSDYSNEQFKIFISLIKFIITNSIKINLGLNISKILISDLSSSLIVLSQTLDNKVAIKMLEYLNIHENDLFTYNLDKKIFILNIFSSLSKI